MWLWLGWLLPNHQYVSTEMGFWSFCEDTVCLDSRYDRPFTKNWIQFRNLYAKNASGRLQKANFPLLDLSLSMCLKPSPARSESSYFWQVPTTRERNNMQSQQYSELHTFWQNNSVSHSFTVAMQSDPSKIQIDLAKLWLNYTSKTEDDNRVGIS